MNAVWFVRSRQFSASFKFVLTITGYNPKEQSLGEMIYLVYALLFFALWGFAVLALCASGAAAFLQMPGFGQPAVVAGTIVSVLIAGWWVFSLFQSTSRSPLKLSPQDAVLLCMTPASRPAVVLAGYANSSLLTGIPVWIVSTVLAFGMIDIRVGGKAVWADMPEYLGAALRFLLPVTLLFLGLLAWSWALGCFRLQGSQRRRGLVWIPVAVFVILAAGLLTPWRGITVPIALPANAGSGAAAFLPGLLVATAWWISGMVALVWASRSVSLARMSQPQETSASLGELLLKPRDTQEVKLQKRLSSGHSASRLPVAVSENAILWKKAIQTTRRGFMGDLGQWLFVFGLGIGILTDPDWISRGLLLIIWIMRVQGLAARGLSADLEMWTLFFTLPYRPARTLLTEIAPVAVITTLLSWFALAVYQVIGLSQVGLAAFLGLPVVALGVSAAAAFDITQRTKAEHLLAGNIPTPGIVAILLALLPVLAVGLALSLPAEVARLLMVVLIAGALYAALPGLLRAGFRKMGR